MKNKDKIKLNIKNTSISDIDITSEEWIKDNILSNGTKFLGWKKSIKYLMKALKGKDALKKKFKKSLRKAYEISDSYKKEDRKELSKLIDNKLEKSKRVRVYADLVQNTKAKHEE